VLIDASFQRARHRLQAKDVAQRTGAHFCLLECWCPEEEIRRRMEARVGRAGAVSEGRWELVAQQRQAFEAPLELPPQEHLRVDTTTDPEAAAGRVVVTLGLAAPGGQAETSPTQAQEGFLQRQG
jgi:predicted kinase